MAMGQTTEPTIHRSTWQWGPYARDTTIQTVTALLWTLHDMGGVVEDPNGRVSSMIVDKAKKLGTPVAYVHASSGSSLSAMWAELENGRWGRCIKRTTGTKRTYKIELLLTPENMPPRPHPVRVRQAEPAELEAAKPATPKPSAHLRPTSVFAEKTTADVTQLPVNGNVTNGGNGGPAPDHVPPPQPEPQPQPQPEQLALADEPDVVQPTMAPLVVIGDQPIDLVLKIQQLAMKAVAAITADMGTPVPTDTAITDELGALKVRLAETVEENNRLRRKVNDGNETITAKARENDALRKALTIAQSNLRAIQEASAQSNDRERNLANMRDVQRTMQAIPKER